MWTCEPHAFQVVRGFCHCGAGSSSGVDQPLWRLVTWVASGSLGRRHSTFLGGKLVYSLMISCVGLPGLSCGWPQQWAMVGGGSLVPQRCAVCL